MPFDQPSPSPELTDVIRSLQLAGTESEPGAVTDPTPPVSESQSDAFSTTTLSPQSDGIEDDNQVFVPIEPQTLHEAGLTESDVESLILKLLCAYGNQQGRKIAKHIKLPFGIVQGVLDNLKNQMLVKYNSLTAANDYIYELTEPGHQRARQLSEICSYCGAAPVGFDKYVASVNSQSLRRHRLTPTDITNAFKELLLPRPMLAQIGQAVNSGRCLFLYGESGNGKTSIATRCIDAYDSGIWIPRTLTVGGEIIRLYDPSIHEELPRRSGDSLLKKSIVDERWVQIKRPKVIVGGELNFAQLELSQNRLTGVLEAPVQMKSNNGCLVIDDFGRQRVTITELLNRWIIPLENGRDYVRLPNGRKIESPFDQLLVFSTNLEPHSLVDEAFFRRIPYKIEMVPPQDEQFAELFALEAKKAGFKPSPESSAYVIKALRQNERNLKYCYASDIIEQCSEFCEYHDQDRILTRSMIDLAIHNYFGGL